MLEQDKILLREKGITEEQLQEQVRCFIDGFPFLKIKAAATTDNGIFVPSQNDINSYLENWDEFCKNHSIIKFVPASGAASRMFKNLYAFLNGKENYPSNHFMLTFFNQIRQFAFFQILDQKCKSLKKANVMKLMIKGQYKDIIDVLLSPKGLNYGNLPKGLLLFHNQRGGNRTPVEEHMAEGAFYAQSADKKVRIHFTVSPEHQPLFMELIKEKKPALEKKYKVTYDISFSQQKPSTDTIAVTPTFDYFRTSDGKLLFRPGGHGSLIENLNDLDTDVVFIKNIDNVVPDRIKDSTIREKKLLGGILVTLQKQIFTYLRQLESGKYDSEDLYQIANFITKNLYCDVLCVNGLNNLTEFSNFLFNKLNRPIRVCAMVRNSGEPGGGPFIVEAKDGTSQLQILESSQIDSNNPKAIEMFETGTHFNPADLVCSLKDYKGNRFDLTKFVDKSTGFISHKSKDGRELLALEHPGLWNGAMSDWNTVFVEVDASTFNPVKTVNDLLRPEHQA